MRPISRFSAASTAVMAVTMTMSLSNSILASSEVQQSHWHKLDDSNILEHCQPTGEVHDTCCHYETVEEVNAKLLPVLDKLVNTTVFRYFKVNLKKECPFWDAHELCSVTDCAVSEADQNEIPKEYQSESLSAVNFSKSQAFSLFNKRCPPSDKDFCILDDELSDDGVFVNLRNNPERYTGYAGESAAKVWAAIYNENCFGIDDVPISQNGLRPASLQGSCTEKRVFYKLLSGLHTSISMHICEEYFDKETQKWVQNLECFKNRIGYHPDRIENLYFVWAVGLRAVSKLTPYLKHYPFCEGSTDESLVKQYVNQVITTTNRCPTTFNEESLFQSEESDDLKIQFRNHFRNISMIMDCVGCQKCRLWGKLQVSGLGTALKILFSYPEDAKHFKLTRSELVALMNGFHRLSESIRALQTFRAMMKEEEEAKLKKVADSATIAPKTPEENRRQLSIEQWANDVLQGSSNPEFKWSFAIGLFIALYGLVRIVVLAASKGREAIMANKKKTE